MFWRGSASGWQQPSPGCPDNPGKLKFNPMSRTATYLVCYDVTEDRERNRVAKLVEGYGLRIQFSVFECRLSRSALAELQRQLEALQLTTGGVAICRLDDRARRHLIGTPHTAEPLAGSKTHSLLGIKRCLTMISPELLAQLQALKWKRLRLTLRRTANRKDRSHPHVIMRAVLYCARSFAARPLRHLRLHWRPASDWWGERLHRDHRYRFDVFLPGASPADVAAYCENLEAHLADPKQGFSIESPVLVEDRLLATLEAETAALGDFNPNAEEVCLDFFTPVQYRKIDPYPWLLTAQEFGRKFAYRMKHLGLPSQSIENLPWHTLQVIQCYWSDYNWGKNAQGKELGRSWKGEPVSGMRGPLYLRGAWQSFLPLFLLAQELQLETGDEARRGQGAFRMLTHRPFSVPWLSPQPQGPLRIARL
jgi:CRISPR-associated protein Cas2